MAKSDYLQREEAAKKQLGKSGVKKRVKQLPTAARSSLREMTGIDVSRRGVSIDPVKVAVAAAGFIPLGKALSVASKASKAVKGVRSGARPMTTAERSAAVTRAGRNRVGKIGIGTKPGRNYEDSYNRAGEIYEKRTGKYSPDNYVKGYEKGVDTKYTNFTESQQVYTNRAMLETVRNANKRKAKGGR